MIITTDGYHSLIEYLTESLPLFEPSKTDSQGGASIELFIRYQLVEQMGLIFEQNKTLNVDEKVYIVEEFDHVFNDLSEVLGRLLKHKITPKQRVFIVDYFGLLKNLCDSQLKGI